MSESDNDQEISGEKAPVILDRAHHSISRRQIDEDALKVLYRLSNHGFTAYLVGGAVRDLLLGRRPADFDVGTNAHPNQIKKLFRNAFLIGRRFRLAHIRFHSGNIIEVSTFRRKPTEEELEEERREDVEAGGRGGREAEAGEEAARLGPGDLVGEADTEIYPGDPGAAFEPPARAEAEGSLAAEGAGDAGGAPPPACRPPIKPIAFGTPQEDAFRRDITINALFYDIATYSVIDYVGGLRDLREGRVRIIGDPAESFTEDPVRIWRVLRHAARLGFTIDARTEAAIPSHRDLLAKCAPSRLYEELNKDFKSGYAAPFLDLVRRKGLLSIILGGIGRLYEDSEAAFGRVSRFLAAVDAVVFRQAAVPLDLTYSLFLWPWAETTLAAADGDKVKFLYDAFRENRPATQFPKSLLLDVFQTLVILEQMLLALETGRMKWTLKKRAHYAAASKICGLVAGGRLTDDEAAFDRIFAERFPAGGASGKRRRRRPRRRGFRQPVPGRPSE